MNCYSPSAFDAPHDLCCICGQRVALETSKANEYGQAVHEDCYVESVALSSGAAVSGLTRLSFQADPTRHSGPTIFTMRMRPIQPRVPRWSADVAAVVVLVIISWVAYGDHGLVAVGGTSNILAPPPATFVAANPQHPKSALTRIRVSPTEVDYIADDVTIRHFTSKPETTHARYRQVDFGDDVTVRYFASTFSARLNASLPQSDKGVSGAIAP